ncbi:MAG: hypothetical protein ACI93G_001819 [Hyphomonas sp.]
MRLERRSIRDPSVTYAFVILYGAIRNPARGQSTCFFVLDWHNDAQVIVCGR